MQNPFAEFDESPDFEISEASMQIYEYIDKELNNRESSNVLRGSAATQCVKRRWYQNHGFKGTPLTPRKILNFSTGDIAERVMIYFIENACVGNLYKRVYFGRKKHTIDISGKEIPIHDQIESSFTFDSPGGDETYEVMCHFDGLGQTQDGRWELIECKTASDFGFKKFLDGDVGDYLKQAHAYMLTEKCRQLGVRRVRFFYFKKQTGHIADRVFEFDKNLSLKVVNEFLTSISQEEPVAPYDLVEETHRKKPTGRKIAGFPCSYCPYLNPCKGEMKKEFKAVFGQYKPIFVKEE